MYPLWGSCSAGGDPSPLPSLCGACGAFLRCDCGIAGCQLNRALCTGPAKLLFIHASIPFDSKAAQNSSSLLNLPAHNKPGDPHPQIPVPQMLLPVWRLFPMSSNVSVLRAEFPAASNSLGYNLPLPTAGCTSKFQVVILQIPLASEECVPESIVRVLGAVKVCQYSFSYSGGANMIQNCLHAFQC